MVVLGGVLLFLFGVFNLYIDQEQERTYFETGVLSQE